MEKHYNIQIHIQEVTPAGVLTDRNGYPVKGLGGAVVQKDKRVVTLLELKISASTEEEAYRRAMALLDTNGAIVQEPKEFAMVRNPAGQPPVTRPIRDNPQA